jgi:DNA mismatch endonuclease (patch repair protein)
MADIVDKKTRSRMMSGIQGKNTKPEMTIRKLLHRAGFRFRIHNTRLAGKPDITLKRYKAIIFVHGCFWHGHDCGFFKLPTTRPDFWRMKISRNTENDARNIKVLLDDGWRVGIIWECALRGKSRHPEEDIERKLVKWLCSKLKTTIIRGNEGKI